MDINKIYHNYIIRVVIFSLFLFKSQIRNEATYKLSVIEFITKRLPWKIGLKVDTGIKLDKETERDLLLDTLLDGIESDYLSVVTVSFNTPLKQTTIKVNLKEVEKYDKFIYG